MKPKKGLNILVLIFLFFIFSFFLTHNLQAASNKTAKCWFTKSSNAKANVNIKNIKGEPFICETSAGLIQVDKIEKISNPDGSVKYTFVGSIKFKKNLSGVKAIIEPVRPAFLEERSWLPHPFVSNYNGQFYENRVVYPGENIPFNVNLKTKPAWVKNESCSGNTVIARIYITSGYTNISEIQVDLNQYPSDLCLSTPTPSINPTPTVSTIATDILPYLTSGYKYKVVNQGERVGFEKPNYDDSDFNLGDAAFGSIPNWCQNIDRNIKTNWPINTDILLRKEFTLLPETKNVKIGVAVDNAAQVFVNGDEVSAGMQNREWCANNDDFIFDVPDNILKPGVNLLAVRGRDFGSVSYLDIRIVASGPVSLTPTSIPFPTPTPTDLPTPTPDPNGPTPTMTQVIR